MATIAFLGHGNVGGALASHLHRRGHRVILGAEADSATAQALCAAHAGMRIAPAAAAVREAAIVFLATPFQANAEVLPPLADALADKVLVDCTNPVGPGLTHGLDARTSGAATVAALVPGAHVVKAFSIYGFENFGAAPKPDAPVRPVMMLCGADAGAKAVVAGLAVEMGWDPLDTGGLEQALHLEHLTLLWIRMVRMGGRSPHLVWARLEA